MTVKAFFLLALTLVVSGGGVARAERVEPPGLSFADRVAAQRAIEEVYWSHRIWPAENPAPKPPLSSVMPDDEIRAKVEDYLRKSNALERWWHRPITGGELQAELDRMTAQTRDAGMLRELFAALEYDPLRIAETLARQTLADRRIREWYAFDERFHGNLRHEAEAVMARTPGVAEMRALGGRYVESTLVLHGDRERRAPGSVALEPGEWTRQMDDLARRFGTTRERLPVGRVSGLQEDTESFFVTAVLALGDDEAVVARVVWPKRSFDAWWAVEREASTASLAAEAGPFVVPAPPDGGCEDDTWQNRFRSPAPLTGHTAVWTGTEMIVWGEAGLYSTVWNVGARYSPATDTWLPASTGPGAPEPRSGNTTVWTGTEMVVWGGRTHGGAYLNTGARYDPVDDTWRPVSAGGAPVARTGHAAVWTGTEMIVWGGDNGRSLNSGGRYDPATDTWVPTSTGLNLPDPRRDPSAVWTGSEVIVWGGWDGNYVSSGGRYDPRRDAWLRTSQSASIQGGRWAHTAVWTGTEMVVWGGRGPVLTYLNTGARYDPVTDSWLPTSVGANVPGPREDHTAVWTGTEMIVWGGYDSRDRFKNTGGRYDPSTDTWIATPTGPDAPAARAAHTAVWTGTEMIVWGGSADSVHSTGARYSPSTDSWTGTSRGDAPAGRSGHTALWTGAEMIVWGGEISNTGGRYDPATDVWTATSTGANVPAGRSGHTAVWTGEGMIVWGGRDGGSWLETGGRYDPSTDTWGATSTGPNVPLGREYHGAVWTGREMIVWGGEGVPSGYISTLNTGGRYDPATGTWTATSTGADVPGPRLGHTAVWTGSELIVWGGTDYDDDGYAHSLNTGGRYEPSTDRWTATSTGATVPEPRSVHTAVWTGSEMIVWGGININGALPPHDLSSGGRYDPAQDAWLATSTPAGVPEPRRAHSAVWTGSEMIVWGGWGGPGSLLDTGGRYRPPTGAWSATSTGENVPWPRSGHTAVWTGKEMLVWGGYAELGNAVGLYCVCADPDGDGVCDDADPFPSSDPSPTVVVGECDSGVANAWVIPGANMGDLIGACRTGAATHGNFVSCVAHLTNDWSAAGLIAEWQKGRIQRCTGLQDPRARPSSTRRPGERR